MNKILKYIIVAAVAIAILIPIGIYSLNNTNITIMHSVYYHDPNSAISISDNGLNFPQINQTITVNIQYQHSASVNFKIGYNTAAREESFYPLYELDPVYGNNTFTEMNIYSVAGHQLITPNDILGTTPTNTNSQSIIGIFLP